MGQHAPPSLRAVSFEASHDLHCQLGQLCAEQAQAGRPTAQVAQVEGISLTDHLDQKIGLGTWIAFKVGTGDVIQREDQVVAAQLGFPRNEAFKFVAAGNAGEKIWCNDRHEQGAFVDAGTNPILPILPNAMSDVS